MDSNFTFTQASNGCISDPTTPITVHKQTCFDPVVNGSRCLARYYKPLRANVSNGASPYYQWTGPSFNGTVASFAVTAAGPYQVTVTDQNLCGYIFKVQIF